MVSQPNKNEWGNFDINNIWESNIARLILKYPSTRQGGGAAVVYDVQPGNAEIYFWKICQNLFLLLWLFFILLLVMLFDLEAMILGLFECLFFFDFLSQYLLLNHLTDEAESKNIVRLIHLSIISE